MRALPFWSLIGFILATNGARADIPPAAPATPPIASVPATEPLSADFTLSAGGASVPVYTARVVNMTVEQRQHQAGQTAFDHTALSSFASFDVSGDTKIEVTCPNPVQTAKVLPVSAGITPSVAGNVVTFDVSKPGDYVVEVNGEWIKSLQLFANPPEKDIPSPSDPNVIYYGPGVHEVETVDVAPGQTVYLAPGAVVYGKPTGPKPRNAIFVLKGANITIRGRGIIDASLCPRDTRSPIYAIDCTHLRLEGVVVRDSGGFTMPVRRSDQVKITNVKVFGWRGNSDGMDICNSREVEVSDCYLRTFDDLIVIKSDLGQGAASGITARHCVLWNEFAHALSIGAELRDPVSNILCTDCDIIHDKGREHLLRVYHCDGAWVQNVMFDNIRIDEARGIMSVWIGKAVWSQQQERGHVQNVVFQNITSVASEKKNEALAELAGFDADHLVENVAFKNVVVDGKPLAPTDVKQNEFVRNVTVGP